MGFLAPWFLGGMVAVGLPVWLHLLRKHRTTPTPFSSLMFFERREQSSIKHRRLRYLVLFALRTLLIALIALAFAQPYIQQKLLPLARSGQITVLAIDNSLSMRADGRLDQAKRMAKSVIGGLRPGERAEVLAFGSRVQVMSEITDDHSPLNGAVDAIEPSDARTSYGELVRSLRSIAQATKQPLDVHLYSDMQQSGMPANFNDLRLNAAVKLEPHAIDSKPVANFAVENVVAPRRVYDNKKTRVLATIVGTNNQKAVRRVTLMLNQREIESKNVEVPENGRATVEFLSLEAPFGANRGEVRIDSADALPNDDHFFFSVERVEPSHALFVHETGNTRGLLYFQNALQASGQAAFVIDEATVEQTANISPAKYAFVVLSDVGSLSPTFENALRSYVRNGGGLLVALGHQSVANAKVPGTDLRVEGTSYASRELERFQAAAYLDTGHPSIQQDNRWGDVKFYQAVRVEPGQARVAVRLTDGTPLLLDEQAGDGHVLVFTSTFDNVENDFPLHASFVPFVEQTARYLGRLNDSQTNVLVGSFAELRNSKEKGAAVDVLDPRGERALSLEEAARAQNIQFTMAGFYDIRRPSGRNEMVAVNTDRHESDLTPVPPETISLWQNTAQGGPAGAGGENGEAAPKPLSLWWYVMLAVLALAFAESFLGNRHLAVDKEAA
ncbi:MAG TPA: BatA domain-containing protein [Bryobacteraceae bacterium]|nr:BatA domain-containing protein [Bryobacteraceae bacterium]